MAATGTKSGGFNTVNGTPEQRELDDESTSSYELGAKSTFLDARARINAAAFYMLLAVAIEQPMSSAYSLPNPFVAQHQEVLYDGLFQVGVPMMPLMVTIVFAQVVALSRSGLVEPTDQVAVGWRRDWRPWSWLVLV